MSNLADFWSLPTNEQGQEISRIEQLSQKGRNPCIVQFGAGPWGKECRECSHFIRVGGHARDYTKCDLRKITNGPGSDHKASFPACARFEKRKP